MLICPRKTLDKRESLIAIGKIVKCLQDNIENVFKILSFKVFLKSDPKSPQSLINRLQVLQIYIHILIDAIQRKLQDRLPT